MRQMFIESNFNAEEVYTYVENNYTPNKFPVKKITNKFW